MVGNKERGRACTSRAAVRLRVGPFGEQRAGDAFGVERIQWRPMPLHTFSDASLTVGALIQDDQIPARVVEEDETDQIGRAHV